MAMGAIVFKLRSPAQCLTIIGLLSQPVALFVLTVTGVGCIRALWLARANSPQTELDVNVDAGPATPSNALNVLRG